MTPETLPRKISPRILTALLGIPIVGVIVWVGGLFFWLVALALALLSLRELEAALARPNALQSTLGAAEQVQSTSSGARLVAAVAYPALITLFGAAWQLSQHQLSAPNLVVTLWFVMWIGFIIAVLMFASRRKISLVGLSLTGLSIGYVSLWIFVPLLRERGASWMWLVLLGVWSSDIAAYFAGRAWGKHPLTPLSPGKTREGALAGLAATVATSTLIGHYTSIGLFNGALLGLIIGCSAPLGDLVESFWKRELGVKDLGTIFPGHGGVLDRCDSLIFSAFVVWLFAIWRG